MHSWGYTHQHSSSGTGNPSQLNQVRPSHISTLATFEQWLGMLSYSGCHTKGRLYKSGAKQRCIHRHVSSVAQTRWTCSRKKYKNNCGTEKTTRGVLVWCHAPSSLPLMEYIGTTHKYKDRNPLGQDSTLFHWNSLTHAILFMEILKSLLGLRSMYCVK